MEGLILSCFILSIMDTRGSWFFLLLVTSRSVGPATMSISERSDIGKLRVVFSVHKDVEGNIVNHGAEIRRPELDNVE